MDDGYALEMYSASMKSEYAGETVLGAIACV